MRDETTAARRARSDAAALTEDLKTLSGRGLLIVSFYRQIVEQLVTWGWTKVRAGEQVVNKPRPGAGDLQEQLAAALVNAPHDVATPAALAGYLVDGGWVRLEPGERIIGLSDAALLNEVQCAYIRWEALKKKVKENRAESAEVSADASELTSDVKPGSDEALILAAFAGADRPLYFDEAAEAAAGHRVSTQNAKDWDRWCAVFRSLYGRGLIEGLPTAEGEVRRYQLTLAGRDLHELDGVDG